MLDEDCGVEVGLWAYPPVACIGDRWGDDGEADGWSQFLPSPSVAFGTSLHVD